MEQGIFAAGDAAVGLRWKRSGFGFTDEDDRLWALGWPHLCVLVDGDVPDKQLTSWSAYWKAYSEGGPEVPRGMVARTLRTAMVAQSQAALLAAARDPSPLRDEEVAELYRLAVRSPRGTEIMTLFEALRGSAVVAYRVLEQLESESLEAWQRGPLEAFGAGPILMLHFLMLRSTRADADAIRGRIHALADRLGAAGLDVQMHRSYGSLRFVLAPEPQGHWLLEYLTPEDAPRIRELLLPKLATMKPADRMPGDARWAFLGGEPIIEAFARHAKGFDKEHAAYLVVRMTRCAHPAVVELMTTVNNARAKKWLRAHGHA